jgi:hypothetical protein
MFKIERPKTDFTQVCNSILRDKRLSLRAKGLYTLMLSKPDDWIFYEEVLVAESTEGRDAVRGAMHKLAHLGWMSKKQPRKDGKFSGNVFETHVTVDWKSGDGQTGDEKSAVTNTEVNKNKEPTPQPAKGECARFDEFWQLYPNT